MLSFFILGNVFAEGSEEQAVVGPCKSDVATLCPGITPGKGAIRDCLKANKEKLSAECSAKISEVKEKAKDIHEVCKAEVEKFCPTVEKGKGAVMKCLKENKDKEGFGAACKADIEQLKKFKKAMKR